MPKNVATDAATREEALRIARERGAAEASRLTGVPSGTIRSWRKRSGESGPPAGVETTSWAQARDAGAIEAWNTAQPALAKIKELLEAGHTLKAQQAAVAFAVLVDKSSILETSAQAALEREARITQVQGQQVSAVIKLFAEAVGLPKDGRWRAVIVGLLRQTAGGEPLVVSQVDAEAARDEFRRQVREEMRAEFDALREQLEREWEKRITPDWIAEHRGLPAAGEIAAGEFEEMVPVAPAWVVTEPDPEPEVGEVVGPALAPSVGRAAGVVRRQAEWKSSGQGRYGPSEYS